MIYREQCENYWPTPEELRACMQEKSCRRPSQPQRIPYDADWYGWLVVVALVWVWIAFL
jgi:hypothetical protein